MNNNTSYNEEQFLEYLDSLIDDDGTKEVLETKFYEKELDIWNQIDNSEEINLEFETTGYKWNIEIELRDDVVSAGFYNNDSELFNISYVFFFRHCTDYSRVVAKPFTVKHIGVNEEGFFLEKYFNRDDSRNIVEDDKVICGVYLRVFKVENEMKYLNNLKSLIDDNNNKGIKDEYFEYKIEKWNNFSNNKLTKYVYPHFRAWRLQFNKKKGPICFRLDDYSLIEGYPPYNANIVLSLHNVNDVLCCHAKPLTKKINMFTKDNYTIKLKNFVNESDLITKNESDKSIIENDETVVGFYIRYYDDGKNKDADKEPEEDDDSATEYDDEYDETQQLIGITIDNGNMIKEDDHRTRENRFLYNRMFNYIRFLLFIIIIILYIFSKEYLFLHINDYFNKKE